MNITFRMIVQVFSSRFSIKYIAILFVFTFSLSGKSQSSNGGRNDIQWFLTSQSQQMIVKNGPVSLLMGSSASEKYRTDDEVQHQVTIPPTFKLRKQNLLGL